MKGLTQGCGEACKVKEENDTVQKIKMVIDGEVVYSLRKGAQRLFLLYNTSIHKVFNGKNSHSELEAN